MSNNDSIITMPIDMMSGMAQGSNMPEKAKVIFSLLQVGLGRPRIAEILGLAVATIDSYIHDYDKDGIIVDAIAARRYFIAGSFESIAAEIASSISFNDIKALSPNQKIAMAKGCIEIAQKINAPAPEIKRGVNDALKALKQPKQKTKEISNGN